MKTWQRICSVLVTTLLILALTIIVNGIIAWNHPCCLCNAMRYHAPCLVDLETGTVTELSIYDPHPTITGELAAEQHTTGTFSFVTCGEAQGYRDTTQKRVEIAVPDAELTGKHELLCEACRIRYSYASRSRYILLDLYEKENAYRISLTDQTLRLRCYEISIIGNEIGATITITGTIEE